MVTSELVALFQPELQKISHEKHRNERRRMFTNNSSPK